MTAFIIRTTHLGCLDRQTGSTKHAMATFLIKNSSPVMSRLTNWLNKESDNDLYNKDNSPGMPILTNWLNKGFDDNLFNKGQHIFDV